MEKTRPMCEGCWMLDPRYHEPSILPPDRFCEYQEFCHAAWHRGYEAAERVAKELNHSDDLRGKIVHAGERVYYFDQNGECYIVYILVDFNAKVVDHSKPYHLAVVVDFSDGGDVRGKFYITGTSDEELLRNCEAYVV